jgi:hypothetical protein
MRRGDAWEALASNQSWNLRLMVTPVPEPNGVSGVLLSLVAFAVLRRSSGRRGSAAR